MSWTPRGASLRDRTDTIAVRPDFPCARGLSRVALHVGGAAILALVVVTVVGILGILGIRGLGPWLIVSDALTPARAIVVLSGQYPLRAMEAAAIYRQGWAPEIWLTRSDEGAGALHGLGVRLSTQDHVNRTVLERLDVPSPAVRFLSADIRNTADELRLVAAELRRRGDGAVIVVTTKAHTRRVRATWRTVVGARPGLIVRFASADPFTGDRWWRDRQEKGVVAHEIFGLLNVWAGFPVRPVRGE